MFTRLGHVCISIFIFLCVISSFVFSKDGFSVGLFGGVGKVSMSDYNSKVDTTNSFNNSIGINSLIKKLDLSIIPEVVISYGFKIPSGGMSIYIKNLGIIVNEKESKAVWPNGIVAQTIKGDFSALYSSIGTRFSLDYGVKSEVSVFLGVDGGICHYFWNTMEETSTKVDGTNIYKIKKDWQTVIPGACLEGGVNYWFTDNLGFGLKGGYRFAAGKVMIKITNISGWTGESQGEDYVDYSGAYVQGGIVYSFAQYDKATKITPDSISDGQFPEIATKLYSEASALFDDGLYKQADLKLTEAEKLSAKSKQIDELKVKLMEKLKVEKSNDYVKKLLKEADDFRQKKDYRKAKARYAEIKIIEPENEYAVYFSNFFKSQSDEAMNNAKALKKQGELKSALINAESANEYDPGNSEIEEFINELRKEINKKDDKNSIYNEGVEHYKKGNYHKAVECWQEVLKIDSTDKEAADNLEKARKKLNETEVEDKESEDKAVKKAAQLFAIGKIDEAQKKCEYVLRINPTNQEALKITAEIKKINDNNRVEALNKR